MNPSRKPRVTIKDVARACGVSTQTISRVLNDRVDVSPTTREKVLAVIDQMGYQPNALARGMRQRSKTLGVIIAGLRYEGISVTLHGVITAAERHGFNLILKELPTFQATNMKDLIRSLMSNQVEGIIYAVPEIGENWINVHKALNKHSPPLVFLKGSPVSAPITISIDNFWGAYAVTRHLIEQGYQHVAHISGPMEWWESRERKRGWTQALADAGRPVLEEAVIEGNWSAESGAACYKALQHRYAQVDAIFSANDQMALAVLHSAWQSGVHIGPQLGLAGFDDLAGVDFYCPPLTTVHQDFHKLGEFAVRKLLSLNAPEMQDAQIEGNSLLIKPEIVVRQSSLRQP